MKLLMDFGNSCCKWAVDNGNDDLQVVAIQYATPSSTERVREILQAINLNEVNQIHAVSVLGDDFDESFAAMLSQHCSCELIFYASQKEAFGITLSYDNVQSYGVDRYSAIVAAHHRVTGDKIVIDCGTATTIDVIDAQGVHAGGLILPGAHLMVKSLSKETIGIPDSDLASDASVLSNNTQSAVYSGCISMMQYGLYGIIKQLTTSDEDNTTLVITGGASHMLNHLPSNVLCERRPNLVLEGLQIMQDK